MNVTAERKALMSAIADTHDTWVPQNLDSPFEPAGEPGDYNQHYVDLEADGEAQDEYASQVAAIMSGGNQTADAKFEELHPRGKAGRFTSGSRVAKAMKSGEPDSLAGFSREQLQREVRRRNRDGAGIKLRRGASVDEIKAALHEHERPESPFRNTPKQDADAVAKAKLMLRRAEQMHGTDRSKWTKTNRDAAAKLDKIIDGDGSARLEAARKRQEAIDKARPVAAAMARIWEAVDEGDMDDATLSRFVQQQARIYGLPADHAIVKAAQTGNGSDIAKALRKTEAESGLTRHGDRSDRFDPATMESTERTQAGAKIEPIRVGYQLKYGRGIADTVMLSKALVQRADESPADRQRAQREAIRSHREGATLEASRGPIREVIAGGTGQKARDAAHHVKNLQQTIRTADPRDRGPEEGAREKARAFLRNLNKKELQDTAAQLGVSYGSRDTAAKILETIVDVSIGSVLTTRSVMRPSDAMGRQTASMDAGGEDLLEEAFTAALNIASGLGEDVTEEAFSAVFMAEFASRMPEHLARYWTEGPGVARVRWFVRGAFRRCRRILKAEGVPGRMLDGTCANLYHRATGRWPGRHRGVQVASWDDQEGFFEFAELDADELDEFVEILLEEMNMDPGTQTACGCGGGSVPNTMGGRDYASEPALAAMAAGDADVWRWEGPLAPIAAPTGDQVARQFAPGALSSRGLPRPLRWQERQERGHDGAVVVGSLTGYRLVDGVPWGEAYFFDENVIPEAGKARYLVEHGVIAPSVDLEPSMDVAYTDENGNVFSPDTCAMDGTCPAEPRQLITRGTIAAATLVPIAAFGELGAGRMFRAPRPAPMSYSAGTQIASVHTSGWDDLPIAPRSHEFDKGSADQRVTEWATGTSGEVNWGRYGRAFLWAADDAVSKGAFKFPVADIVNGELTIIPQAVFNAAARLNQADVPADAKDAMRDVISDLYDQMAEHFDDDDIIAPWDDDREEMSVQGCGCASKMAAAAAEGSQTAAAGCSSCGSKYGVFGNIEPYPADAFAEIRFDKITPLQVEQRPGEPFARLFGHIADWKGCHRSFKHVCLPPPRSRTNYAEFHTAGNVRTPDGLLRVGKVVMGEGHPDASVSARVARAYYDATSKEVGHVRGYEDQFGPYVNGVVAPGVSPEEAVKLLASPPSGHWTDHELICVLAVNVAGHPVRTEATFGPDGQPVSMVAAGRWWPDEEDGLAEAEEILWAAEHAQLMEAIR